MTARELQNLHVKLFQQDFYFQPETLIGSNDMVSAISPSIHVMSI
jgi:hypothetical protein